MFIKKGSKGLGSNKCKRVHVQYWLQKLHRGKLKDADAILFFGCHLIYYSFVRLFLFSK